MKKETEAAHQDTEALLLPKLTCIQSVAGYAAVLRMFYGYFHPLEEKIQAFVTPALLPDIRQRRTSFFILEDLKAMRIEAGAVPVCQALPAVNNLPQAFGAMYVLEGSTLGGKMIAKMLSKNVAVPAEALRFFSGYKDQTGAMWTAFVAALNQQRDIPAVVSSAAETFSFLSRWMQQTL